MSNPNTNNSNQNKNTEQPFQIPMWFSLIFSSIMIVSLYLISYVYGLKVTLTEEEIKEIKEKEPNATIINNPFIGAIVGFIILTIIIAGILWRINCALDDRCSCPWTCRQVGGTRRHPKYQCAYECRRT